MRLFSEFPACSEGGSGAPVRVNSPSPVPINGAGFVGWLIFLNRPDPEPPDGGWPYAEHFAGKSRRFELRLQGRFLVDPGEDVFFGVEIPEAVVLSTGLRMTSRWILSLVSVLCAARGVAYSYSLDLEEQADGSVVRPHLAFPACAADAIVATPPGQEPPNLAAPLRQLGLDEKLRVRLNTRDTFTFAYWSKQADFARWEMCNLPLGWSSSFSSFIGSAPIHLTAYSLKRRDPGGPLHEESRKRLFMRLVLRGGPGAAAGAEPDPGPGPEDSDSSGEVPWGTAPEPPEQEISFGGALAKSLRRAAARVSEALPRCCIEALVASACLPTPPLRRPAR